MYGELTRPNDIWEVPGLMVQQKEKEELDDITMELELADEDDTLPSVNPRSNASPAHCDLLTQFIAKDTRLATLSST